MKFLILVIFIIMFTVACGNSTGMYEIVVKSKNFKSMAYVSDVYTINIDYMNNLNFRTPDGIPHQIALKPGDSIIISRVTTQEGKLEEERKVEATPTTK